MFASAFGDACIQAGVGWMTAVGSMERRGE
jgi:hypothetical protein